ncbi:NADH-quinone oxidoreductase subunit H, partial [Acinetobacter baumannii]
MKFAVFFMGEYAAMFVFSGIFATVFLGGYNALPVRWEVLAEACQSSAPAIATIFEKIGQANHLLAPVWFFGKIAFFISFYIWLRATLPRLRY